MPYSIADVAQLSAYANTSSLDSCNWYGRSIDHDAVEEQMSELLYPGDSGFANSIGGGWSDTMWSLEAQPNNNTDVCCGEPEEYGGGWNSDDTALNDREDFLLVVVA